MKIDYQPESYRRQDSQYSDRDLTMLQLLRNDMGTTDYECSSDSKSIRVSPDSPKKIKRVETSSLIPRLKIPEIKGKDFQA